MSPNAPPRPGQTAPPGALFYCSRDCKLPEDKNGAPVSRGPRGLAQSRGSLKEGCLSYSWEQLPGPPSPHPRTRPSQQGERAEKAFSRPK